MITIPIIFEDKKHSAWRPKVGDQLASNNHVNLEEGWVWCNKCQGLFKGGRQFSDPSSGNCPADGKHSTTGSSNYSLWRSSQTQTNYHRCTKCQGLFGGSGVSICGADGGQHSQDSSPYVLVSVADIQDEWKYQTKWFNCKKCLLVFFGGITTGECPAHGHHDYTDRTNWGLIQSQFNKVQGDWSVCRRCKGLFFGGNPGSKCPAGGERDKTGSKNYYIAINSPKYPGDHSRRWCHKCQGLFYIAWKATKCPADGGEHSRTSSAIYCLDSGEEAPNEIEWRLCFNCMGLFFSGGSPQAGKCPSFPDKGHSIGTGFYNFGVMT